MKLNIYCIENVLTSSSSGLYLFRTDAMASRALINMARQLNQDLDLSELRLYCIGSFDDETKDIIKSVPKLVSWNVRNNIEVQSENKSIEDIEKDMNSMH